MKIKTIFDNRGRTFDRYTVILEDGLALGLSLNPDSPIGFSQWGEAVEGYHLGERISFEELPEIVQKHVKTRTTY